MSFGPVVMTVVRCDSLKGRRGRLSSKARCQPSDLKPPIASLVGYSLTGFSPRLNSQSIF
ncbi:unnamed protein product, partial [Protopolystoma xenopodis]